MDVSSRSSFSKTRSLALSLIITLVGVGMMAGFGWLLVFRPDSADQITAIVIMSATILVILLDPLAGFLLWLFLFPFAPFLPFNISMPAGVPDLSYPRMIGGFLTMYLLAQIVSGRRKMARVMWVDLAAPFLIFALALSGARSINGWLWGVQSTFDSSVMPLLVYFIARQLVRTRQDLLKFGAMLMAIAAVIATFTITEQLFGFAPFRVASAATVYTAGVRKVAVLLANPAYIAVTIAIVIPVALERLLHSRSPAGKVFFSALTLLYLAAIALTYNRSGWISGALALLVAGMLVKGVRRFLLPTFLAGGVALFLLWPQIQNSPIGERLTAESPVDYRLQALQVGLDLAREQPILGIGWGSFGRMAAARGFRQGANIHVLPTTHNSYLNFLVSGGVLLLASYLLLLAALFLSLIQVSQRFRSLKRPLPLYLLLVWASVFAYIIPIAAFDNNFAIYTNVLFWGLMGAALSAADGEAESLFMKE
ncbi:MAG: hypothetical protein GXP42_10440 [Chloroflexi bacterium]|nr:hypothetical protein [Chloroflexota bacterium]